MAGPMLAAPASRHRGGRAWCCFTRLEDAPRYDLRGGPLGGDVPRGTAGRAHVRVRFMRVVATEPAPTVPFFGGADKP